MVVDSLLHYQLTNNQALSVLATFLVSACFNQLQLSLYTLLLSLYQVTVPRIFGYLIQLFLCYDEHFLLLIHACILLFLFLSTFNAILLFTNHWWDSSAFIDSSHWQMHFKDHSNIVTALVYSYWLEMFL